MPKEKEKAGDTPEELNMLFRKTVFTRWISNTGQEKCTRMPMQQPRQKAISKEWKRG